MSESDYFPVCRYTRKPTRRQLHRCADGTVMLQVVRIHDGQLMYAHKASRTERSELSFTVNQPQSNQADELPTVKVRSRSKPQQ
jgi:hypothetical protein